jgi:Ran GTPase-activating protein (RanGAP) involved in mRNA processing and transport
MEECNIGDEGFICIGESLEQSYSLKMIDLSNNGITYKGAIKFAECLKDNTMIKILLLHWNKIGPKGGEAFANALIFNRSL